MHFAPPKLLILRALFQLQDKTQNIQTEEVLISTAPIHHTMTSYSVIYLTERGTDTHQGLYRGGNLGYPP